jgi:hypothetical protein
LKIWRENVLKILREKCSENMTGNFFENTAGKNVLKIWREKCFENMEGK